MLISALGDATTIYALAFSADGQSLYAGTKDGRVLAIAPFAEPRVIGDLSSWSFGPCTINSLAAHPDGRVFLATSNGHGFLDPEDSEAGTLEGTGGLAVAAIALWDDETVVLGLGDRDRPGGGHLDFRTIRCSKESKYDRIPRARRFKKWAEPHGVRAVSVHAESGLVAWSTGHQKVSLWNPRKQDPVQLPLKQTSPAIAFHPDGERLAVAQDRGGSILDLVKKHEALSFKGHTGRVTCLAYRPDGQALATGSWDGSVRLWDAATAAPLGTLAAPLGRIFALAYAPDGLRLAAGGDAGNVVVWDVE